jgi:glycosyltransferase involved in cell wall biosynthesis
MKATRPGTAGEADGVTQAAAGTVLCVANFPSNTGYAWWLMEEFWVAIGREAEAAGLGAVVAFPVMNGVSQRLRDSNLSVVELAVPTSMFRRLGDLRRFIRERAVRVVYFTDRPYWSPAYALLRLWGVRSIVLHDHVPGERPRPSWWKLGLKRMRHLVRPAGADLYIGVSDFVHRRFSEVGGVPARYCTFVHNGIVSGIAGRPRDIRQELDLPAASRVVVSVGRANYYKGIDFVVECAARMVGAGGYDDVYFVHVGDGPHLGEFRSLAARLGVDHRVIFAGERSDVRELLPSCTVAFHASHGEAFSLAVLEYMAAALPAVVPDHCGNGEAIADGVTGRLYVPRDHDAAISALAQLLDDPDLRSAMGAAARRRVDDEFSFDRMIDRFVVTMRPFIRG